MSKFTGILEVSPLADGRTWILRKEFGYDIGKEGSGNSVDVPVGFMTDFASVPRMFRWLVSKWGRHGNATVIHDYCYWTQENGRDRKRSDRIFKEAMEVSGVKAWRKWLIYLAVSWFGRFAWEGNIKLKKKEFNRVAARLPEKATDTPNSLQAKQ